MVNCWGMDGKMGWGTHNSSLKQITPKQNDTQQGTQKPGGNLCNILGNLDAVDPIRADSPIDKRTPDRIPTVFICKI